MTDVLSRVHNKSLLTQHDVSKVCPYYHLAPKDYLPNLLFRQDLTKRAMEDAQFADDLWVMCKRDGLFFLNVFGWSRDTKEPTQPIRPFITHPYQDQVLVEIWDAAGLFGGRRRDVHIKKSRDMILTWTCVAAHIWPFVFWDMIAYLWVSRKEEYVWKAGDPKALFSRGSFMLDMLPPFLQPPLEDKKLHLQNLLNGAAIDGESTTENASAGDKRGQILLDEFALSDNGFAMLVATSQAADSRVFNSTPRGTGTAFYEIEQDQSNKLMTRIRLHWPIHPEHGAGLYTHVKGRLMILDKEYQFPADFEFVFDADYKARSPWYDIQCQRAGSKREIAQELDMNDFGAGDAWFDDEDLRTAEQFVRPPFLRGKLRIDMETAEPKEFTEFPNGNLELWIPIETATERPVPARYVVGCDISAGTGASDSTACIGNADTREKVAQLVANDIGPHEFAELVVALCRWFNDAFLGWEAPGPGRQFGERVLELGYGNIFYQSESSGPAAKPKKNEIPGWWPTNQTKQTLLAFYRRVWARGDFVNRSDESIKQARRYQFGPNNTVIYAGQRSDDASGTGDNHGDLVIGDALCCKMMFERQRIPDTRPEVPKNSLYWYRRELEMQQAEEANAW